MSEKLKKTLLALLAVGAIRIVNEIYEPELYASILEGNQWEAEEGKHLFEFVCNDNVGGSEELEEGEDQWASDLSGYTAYVSSIEEFVDSANEELDSFCIEPETKNELPEASE